MKVLFLAFCAFATTNLHAQSLKDKKIIAENDEIFKQELADTNKACGTKIAGKIDWASFSKGKVDLTKFNIGDGYCKDAIFALKDLCSDATAKAEISKKVKSYTCKFGGPGKRAISLKGGTVEAMIELDASNNSYFFREKLEELL
jgi:hypothetical protein